MRRLWRDRKAIFSIIIVLLILLIHAWIEMTTFKFVRSEELKIVGHSWVDANTVNLTVTNIGLSDATIYEVRVNYAATSWCSGTADNLLTVGSNTWVAIDSPYGNFLSGYIYSFEILTARGFKYVYQAAKP